MPPNAAPNPPPVDRPAGPRRRSLWLPIAALAAAALPTRAAEPLDDAVRTALQAPGAIVLMRHATAPGVGDPPGFRLGDCATQRNLSEAGRAEARAAGERLRAAGIVVGRVLSSPWCRCLETARLLAHGEVQASDAFASSFREDDRREAEIARAAQQLLDAWRGPGVLVAVTHQVNIQSLTGENTASGEMLVLQRRPDGGHAVAGRLR